MIIYETRALNLLTGDNKDCEILFQEFVKLEYDISLSVSEKIISEFKSKNFKYLYLVDSHSVICTKEEVQLKEYFKDSKIICFIQT